MRYLPALSKWLTRGGLAVFGLGFLGFLADGRDYEPAMKVAFVTGLTLVGCGGVLTMLMVALTRRAVRMARFAQSPVWREVYRWRCASSIAGSLLFFGLVLGGIGLTVAPDRPWHGFPLFVWVTWFGAAAVGVGSVALLPFSWLRKRAEKKLPKGALTMPVRFRPAGLDDDAWRSTAAAAGAAAGVGFLAAEGPAFNIDGLPMLGAVDVAGKVFGDAGHSFDTGSSHQGGFDAGIGSGDNFGSTSNGY